MRDLSYDAVISRKNEIMKKAVGIDYEKFMISDLVFDYEKMMDEVGYSLDKVREIQAETGVGNTTLVELKQINRLIKKIAPKGKGARIFIKDEATNPSGSYKDRRASVSVYHAQKHGYKGVIAATSGNYGAAVASQAAKRGLKCIIAQECYDSKWIGQPEILEKARSCEAYGAEVVQLTVGPELFYYTLVLLEETGFFNASLYTPYAIAGVETLGYEIAEQTKEKVGKYPDIVVITHAGGGILTGTARGLKKAGATNTEIVAASVNLKGLHMASDNDFNKKYFTTGHTGFGIPFATFPDRSDVPKNAARALRYMDRYLLVSQGEVFYITEMLAQLEGMQRGPAGNTSLAAAFALALEMDDDKVIVVNETEYTGAGKLPSAQLTFARKMGMEIKRGDPIKEDIPGKSIVIPEHPFQIGYIELDMENVRKSYVKEVMKRYNKKEFNMEEVSFMAEDTNTTEEKIKQYIKELGGELIETKKG